VRHTAIAFTTAAFGATLMTGTGASADIKPVAERAKAQPAASTSQRVASGNTEPGQGWTSFHDMGICNTVDTSSAHFTGTPTYVASVAGSANQWLLTGSGAIYDPKVASFTVCVKRSDGVPVTPADAQVNGWYVHWIGVDNP
jgi:hypothetical protein